MIVNKQFNFVVWARVFQLNEPDLITTNFSKDVNIYLFVNLFRNKSFLFKASSLHGRKLFVKTTTIFGI